MLISQITEVPFYGLIPDLSNVHIYENHFDAVDELLNNDPNKYKNDKVILKLPVNATSVIKAHKEGFINKQSLFNCLNISDIKVEGYDSYPAIKAEMIAPNY